MLIRKPSYSTLVNIHPISWRTNYDQLSYTLLRLTNKSNEEPLSFRFLCNWEGQRLVVIWSNLMKYPRIQIKLVHDLSYNKR